MTWFLTVMLYIGGIWVSGNTVDGWSDYPMNSEEHCRQGLAYAESSVNPSFVKLKCELK